MSELLQQEQHNLAMYSDLAMYSTALAFEEAGWDDLGQLHTISEPELEQLMNDVKMKSGHVARLRKALAKEPPATAASAVISAAISLSRHLSRRLSSRLSRCRNCRRPTRASRPSCVAS